MFWGARKLSYVAHLDIRAFLIDVSKRDLSADIMHRYIWALRCFFDFLCRGGVVDDVAPRLVRPRPVRRPLPKTLSEANVRRLIKGAGNPRDRAIFEVFYATGCRVFNWHNVQLRPDATEFGEHIPATSNRQVARTEGTGKFERTRFQNFRHEYGTVVRSRLASQIL